MTLPSNDTVQQQCVAHRFTFGAGGGSSVGADIVCKLLATCAVAGVLQADAKPTNVYIYNILSARRSI
jgi:hypothetical protein